MTSLPHDRSLIPSPTAAIESKDLEMGAALASKRHHPWVRRLCAVGEIGDQGPLYLIGAAMVAGGVIRKDPRCGLAGVSWLAAVAVPWEPDS